MKKNLQKFNYSENILIFNELICSDNFISKYLNTTKLADSKFKSIQKLNYKKLQFTDTEIAIINLLSIGYNINQAADIINLNVHTAKKYLYENIRNKILPFVDTDDFNSDYFKIVLRYVSTILPMSTLFLTKTIII